ncbi:hypothetical protein HYS97_03105, partial [Candidatus Daviesbacteria bacterium]|nr:hypothetical protein [Candidatus Daviesbacteria bacterium]
MSIYDYSLSRRDCLKLGVSSALFAVLPFEQIQGQSLTQPEVKPLVGAIRWGGWFSGSRWAKNLEDQKWHSRLPFYSKIGPDGKSIEILGDRQEVMDQEILYAKKAGIDFWAYCFYDNRSYDFNIYNYGFRRHLASKLTTGPKIALILQGSHFGGASG